MKHPKLKSSALILGIFFSFLFLFSCNRSNEHVIEGDLYFKVMDFERVFDLPDSVLTKIESHLETVDADTLTTREKKIYDILRYMKEKDLLRKPFVRLRLDNGDERVLFLDSSDYNQFAHYQWRDFSNNKKKVRVKAQVTELHYDTITAFETEKLISVKMVKGETYWRK